MFLGIEIGGTKLQLGLGDGAGVIHHLWRGRIDPASGGEGIRQQIATAYPELLALANADRFAVRGVGVGFGGPTDDDTQSVITSHQVAGWDGFPLADWLSDLLGLPATIGNDADVAGLAEALFGAGKGLSPIFYITVGSGIGGGLIIDGKIYRGVGKGAAEIGHLSSRTGGRGTVEDVASGWGIESMYAEETNTTAMKVPEIVAQAAQGDGNAAHVIEVAVGTLAEAISTMVTLLCPRRVVVGGGVPQMGEVLFFAPLRARVAEKTFAPFRGLTDIVPASLGEEVVVHGALALARQRFGE